MSAAMTPEEVQSTAAFLKSEFARGSTKMRTFRLEGPVQATIKRADGNYRKKSFIGGEEFRASTAYAGKARGVIVVLTPKSPATDFAQVEFELEDSLQHMDKDFQDLVMSLLAKVSEELEAGKEVRAKKQEQVLNEMRSRNIEDPRYGAW